MRVVAAIDGRIASEVAALYALKYASVHGFAVELVHVRRPELPLAEVEASMESLETMVPVYGVSCSRHFLEGEPVAAMAEYLYQSPADFLFCGTCVGRRHFRNSFPQRLIRSRPGTNVAAVRAVHVGATLAVEDLLLPIRGDRLDVRKFTFALAMLKAYDAAGEIYSVSRLSRRKRAKVELEQVREMLERINHHLSHYTKLSELAATRLRIKHAFAEAEVEQILHHLSHHGYQLMILDGRRFVDRTPFRRPPIERLLAHTPTNTIVLYLDEGR